MPECHKCPHADHLDRFAHLPYEKTPCYRCHWTGDQINHHGRTHISIDAMDKSAEQSLGMVEAAMQPVSDDTSDARRVALPEDLTGRVIAAGLQRMTNGQRNIALLFLGNPGATGEAIARMIGKTPQLVSATWKVCRRVWRDVAAEMTQ